LRRTIPLKETLEEVGLCIRISITDYALLTMILGLEKLLPIIE
jgi:hypothetical protein